MNSMKKSIVIAMVGISMTLSLFVLYYMGTTIRQLIETSALEQRVSFLVTVVTHVQSELDHLIHPMDHLAFFIEETPPTTSAPTNDYEYQLWQESLTPYVESLFNSSSPNETLELYFVDALGMPVNQHLIFRDLDQDGFLDAPVLDNQLPSSKEIQYIQTCFYNRSSTWLPTTKHTKLDPAETIYWHYALPVFDSKDSQKPFAILILRGPMSLFSKHLPGSKLDSNPMIALYEYGNHLITTTDFFPLNNLDSYSQSPVSELIDAATKYSFSIKTLSLPDQSQFTTLNRKLSSGWTVVYLFPTATLSSAFNDNKVTSWFILVLFLIITTLLALRISDYISLPLKELIGRFHRTDEQQPFPRAPLEQLDRKDELGLLVKTFDQLSAAINESQHKLLEYQRDLEQQVTEKNAALRQTNQLLKASIKQLDEQEIVLDDVNKRLLSNIKSIEQTRHQLMASNKTASLKYMVSGVAHELNTPIGNAITLTSYLEKEYALLLTEIGKEDSVQVAPIRESLTNLLDSLSQLERNTQQAEQIIQLIKTMAQAELGAEPETFDIGSFIDELATNILKDHSFPIDFQIVSPENLMVTTDPAKLSALLNPLIQNSLDHGFSGNHQPSIHISVVVEQQMVILDYNDNGRGVSEKDLPHLFTPFFTTQFGNHKGLGLSAAYNIASLYFKGSMEVIPKNLPGICIRCQLNTLSPVRR